MSILPLRLVSSVVVVVMVFLAVSRSFVALSFSVASAAFSSSKALLSSFAAARSFAKVLFWFERASFAEKNEYEID